MREKRKIERERLCIRNISGNDDIAALLRIYNSKQNMQYISDGKSSWTREELLDKLKAINNTGNAAIGIFLVTLKENGKVVGEAGVFDSFASVAKLEIGYIVDSAYWRKGFGTEICKALISYSFDKLSASRLVTRMYAANTA